MSTQEFDLIQRIRVENGIPRVVSTTIKVIEGGEDLLSEAITLLKEHNFYEKFTENRTSQYIGYRSNTHKTRHYQLILSQRKNDLCISIPKKIIKRNIGNIFIELAIWNKDHITLAILWIKLNKEDQFLENFEKNYPNLLKEELKGCFYLNQRDFKEYQKELKESWSISVIEECLDNYTNFIKSAKEFNIKTLGDPSNYLLFEESKLFPYAYQVLINNNDTLKEFLNLIIPLIMEN